MSSEGGYIIPASYINTTELVDFTIYLDKQTKKRMWVHIMKSYGYVVSRKGNLRGLKKRNYSEWVLTGNDGKADEVITEEHLRKGMEYLK